MRVDGAIKKTFSIITSVLLNTEEVGGNKVLRKVCDTLKVRGGAIGGLLSEMLSPNKYDVSESVSMLAATSDAPSSRYIQGKVDRMMLGAGMAGLDQGEEVKLKDSDHKEPKTKPDQIGQKGPQLSLKKQHELIGKLTGHLQTLGGVEAKQEQVFLEKYNFADRLIENPVFADQASSLAVHVAMIAGASVPVLGIISCAVALVFTVAARVEEWELHHRGKKVDEKAMLTHQEIETIIKDVLIEILSSKYGKKYPDITALAIENIRSAMGLAQVIDTYFYGAIILIEGIEKAQAVLAKKESDQGDFPHLIRTQREAFNTLDREYRALRDPTPEFFEKARRLYENIKIQRILVSFPQLEMLKDKLAIEQDKLKILKAESGNRLIESEAVKAKKQEIQDIRSKIKELEEFRGSVNPEVLVLADQIAEFNKKKEQIEVLLEPQRRILQSLEELQQELRLLPHPVTVEQRSQPELAALHPTVKKRVLSPTHLEVAQKEVKDSVVESASSVSTPSFASGSSSSHQSPTSMVQPLRIQKGMAQHMTLGFIERRKAPVPAIEPKKLAPGDSSSSLSPSLLRSHY